MGLSFLPASASTAALRLNPLFALLLVISLAVLGLVVLLLLTFCIRYRANHARSENRRKEEKSWRWEISWTAGSFVVFLGLYAWGAELYLHEHQPPPNASDIYIVGKRWMWKAEHPDGQREINALHVSVEKPVRLIMTSEDVIHGFFVPAFRLKQDVLPGRYVTLSFTPSALGDFHLFCSQFCGVAHAEMTGTVTVMTEGDYQKWLGENLLSGSLAIQGSELYRRLGCAGCHESAMAVIKAPSLRGLYKSEVRLRGGSATVADEGFIRQAILEPATQPIAGYASIMPSFAGQLNEDDVVRLVAYIKSLAGQGPTQ